MSHLNFLSKLLNLVHIYMLCHSKLHFAEQIACLFEMWYFIELLLLHCTTHAPSNTLPFAFHNPPMHTNNKHIVGKMAQDVGMV